jgi:hypothetical protein
VREVNGMEFVQIMEFNTSDIGAIQALDQEWIKATEGSRTARRQLLARDRNNPERYLALIFFDSYESAMTNSSLPATQAIAEKYQAAVNGITFHDLDVVSDEGL